MENGWNWWFYWCCSNAWSLRVYDSLLSTSLTSDLNLASFFWQNAGQEREGTGSTARLERVMKEALNRKVSRVIPHASFFSWELQSKYCELIGCFFWKNMWKEKMHWVDVSWWFPSDFPIRFGIADALPAGMMPRPRERKRWMQTTTSWHLYWGRMRWDFDPGWGTAVAV